MSHLQTTAPAGARTSPVQVASAEWDLMADTVHWSPAAYRLLDREPGLGPLTLDQLPSLLVPQDRPALCRMVTEALVHGRALDGVVRVGRHEEAAVAVRCSGRPALGPDGHVVSLRMLLRAG
ncbi:hypothetical protein P3T36_006009 [Kitasatospora sp. MAP12-15]|uniref:hypothetical protein n=1 Tax=unclassified Kitasatospora TaxID=2633591 RepID=UPI0024741594|nr:hypothetical protein [Kitasatospora sp. MAP12-44]MDH6109068.1 hypothetical protein [Kitasatospora sp. MAP12-44]